MSLSLDRLIHRRFRLNAKSDTAVKQNLFRVNVALAVLAARDPNQFDAAEDAAEFFKQPPGLQVVRIVVAAVYFPLAGQLHDDEFRVHAHGQNTLEVGSADPSRESAERRIFRHIITHFFRATHVPAGGVDYFPVDADTDTPGRMSTRIDRFANAVPPCFDFVAVRHTVHLPQVLTSLSYLSSLFF